MARGGIDLGARAYRKVSVGLDLLRPPALFANMSGRGVRMLWTLDGAFARADYAYRLTSAEHGVRWPHRLRQRPRRGARRGLAPWPMRVPLRLRAAAVTGVGDVAGGILRNISLEGMLAITPTGWCAATSSCCAATSSTATVSLLIDLATGRFDIMLAGGLKRYLIPGVGIVDVETRAARRARTGRQGIARRRHRARRGCGGSTMRSSPA